MQSNPIQQRIELICDKWEDAKKNTAARIVRIRCQPDEGDMVDTFYTYMICADTRIADIAFHFDSTCSDPKLFSGLLLKELEEIMEIWNNSVKDERIEFVKVDWKPDYSLTNDKNHAFLFVENFNRLAKALDLQEELFTVAIIKTETKDKQLTSWLKAAIEAKISKAVKFLIYDTVEDLAFETFAKEYAPLVTTIPINLNMPKAMEQAAAMGDPNDPATEYRQVFVKMINAMGAGKEKESEKWADECISIASKNLAKDPYWVTQLVVVYIALGTDKIRYKKKAETLGYANKAVETATAAQAYFENGIAAGLLAQALMFRATILFVEKKWNEAYADFSTSFDIYQKQSNMALGIEAARMAGRSAIEGSQKPKGAKILAEAIRLGKQIDDTILKGSSYPGLIELYIQTENTNEMSQTELDAIAREIYGPNWRDVIKNWKKIPEKKGMQKQQVATA